MALIHQLAEIDKVVVMKQLGRFYRAAYFSHSVAGSLVVQLV